MTETRGEIFHPNVLDNAKVRVLDNGSVLTWITVEYLRSAALEQRKQQDFQSKLPVTEERNFFLGASGVVTVLVSTNFLKSLISILHQWI